MPSQKPTLTNDPSPDYTQNFPRGLWRFAWMILVVVVAGGAILAILLAGGAADPPRAGPLRWQTTTPTHYTMTDGAAVPLPAFPYTLEVTAQAADPWEITFDNAAFSIVLDGQGFFSVPPFQPDSIPFLHIHSESNTITLNTDASGQATLRINGEIAWRGSIPESHMVHITLSAETGSHDPANALVIRRIALYAPNPTAIPQ